MSDLSLSDLDISDSYYVTNVMEIIDEAEKDLSINEFKAVLDELIEELRGKMNGND